MEATLGRSNTHTAEKAPLNFCQKLSFLLNLLLMLAGMIASSFPPFWSVRICSMRLTRLMPSPMMWSILRTTADWEPARVEC